MINYNNKKFKAISNSENGELSTDTVFHYKQEGNVLHSEYSGGPIIKGHLIGKVHEDGSIELVYHQINDEGIIKTGRCNSSPEIMENGKIRLKESWEWLSGDKGKGESLLIEI